MGQMNQPAGSGSRAAQLLRVVLTPTIIFSAAVLANGQRVPGAPLTSTLLRFSSQAPSTQTGSSQATAPANRLTRDQAARLALAQASAFQTARYSEAIAEEDVRQARAAFLPRITVPSTVTYNSPTLGPVAPGTPRSDRFSFIAANAVIEYESLVGAGGEIDIAGRLRAALRRSVALLEAARAGTEIARRTLLQAVDDAYYGLALAITKRRSAELSLRAAEEFARVTDLMLNAGEVAEVDSTRARLQVASRRDELQQASVNEAVAAGGLRVLIGYDFSTPLEINDLTSELPNTTELDRFVASAISNRPEFAQFEAQRRAAEQDRKAARAERLPQVT
jgi:outer membrane protein TolC